MKIKKENSAGILLVLVSCIVIALSVYFTYKTNHERLGSVIAILFSIAVVLFNTIALSVSSIFFRQKTFSSFAVGFILSLMFVFTTIYSITNTMNVMYEGNKGIEESFNDEQIVIDGFRNVIAIKEKQILNINTEIEEIDKAIKTKEADIEKYDTMEDWKTRAFQARQARDGLIEKKTVLMSEKKNINKEIEQIALETPEAVSKKEVEKQDSVYSFYATLLRKDERTIRSFIDLIPSFFLDLIAPITMALAIYFFGKKETENPYQSHEDRQGEVGIGMPINEYVLSKKPETKDLQTLSIIERWKTRAEETQDEKMKIRVGFLKEELDKLYEYKNRELYEKISEETKQDLTR